MNYLHILMMASVALIVLTLFTLQYVQSANNQPVAAFHIDYSKVNLPGPNSKLSTEEQAIEVPETDGGKIVFLKEDLHNDSEEAATAQLSNYNENQLTEDERYMQELTKTEPRKSGDGTDKYLVIAGTYTDDMILLSKQAQYMNKGYKAEIIQFENTVEKNICIGRFDDQSSADIQAQEIENTHDISTYVYHQIAGR